LALTLLLTVIPPACSILDPDPDEVRVANRTGSSIHVIIWEQEAAALVDPAPSFDFVPGAITILAPGEVRTFPPEEIQGEYEPGDGVVLFVYEIQGNTALLRTLESLTRRELRSAGYRIRIREL
jgi:hypothetical protein